MGGVGFGWPLTAYEWRSGLIYQLKRGARLPKGITVQAAGEEVERLESEGRLTPKDLVEDSRPEDAPLHRCFEWDDTVAAERYREVQAAYIIRSVEVTVESVDKPTRAFVYTVVGGQRECRSIGVVLRDAYSRDALLESALRELASFQRKYRTLSELDGVFGAIDGLIGSQTAIELTS